MKRRYADYPSLSAAFIAYYYTPLGTKNIQIFDFTFRTDSRGLPVAY